MKHDIMKLKSWLFLLGSNQGTTLPLQECSPRVFFREDTRANKGEKKKTMSWQEMESDKINIDAEGYRGVPHDDSYAALSSGQKRSANSAASSPSWGQRVALAIVSLVLWILVFGVVVLIITTTPEQIITMNGANAHPVVVDNSKAFYVITFLMTFGLVIFSSIVLVINILFNWKR